MYSQIEMQNQYQGTNIAELLQGITQIRTRYIAHAIHQFRRAIDLRTASGDVLEMWGRLLNFSRYIPTTQDNAHLFNNFDFYDKSFIKLKFQDKSDIAYSALSDDAYRLVLQLLWSSRNIQANIYQVSQLATEIFKVEVIVGDSMDMSYVTYYFRDEIPQWLSYILENYQILPRPACVGSRYISAVYKLFGFKTNDNVFNKKYTAFWNSRFADDIMRSGAESQELADTLTDTLADTLTDTLTDTLAYVGANNLEQIKDY